MFEPWVEDGTRATKRANAPGGRHLLGQRCFKANTRFGAYGHPSSLGYSGTAAILSG